MAEKYHTDHEYAIYLFHNTYDIPLKTSDKKNLWESEEMYEYLICAICPVSGDYEPGEPECGFLFVGENGIILAIARFFSFSFGLSFRKFVLNVPSIKPSESI